MVKNYYDWDTKEWREPTKAEEAKRTERMDRIIRKHWDYVKALKNIGV